MGEPWRGPSVERVFKGRQGTAIASMCGEPSTRWVLPVEMEQTLWGDTFGVGAGLPRVASQGSQRGSRTLLEGALLKCKFMALPQS